MKDDPAAIFGLKAFGKGKEAKGPDLRVVDHVRLYLSLYGVYGKNTHKSGVLAPLEGDDIGEFPAPKGFPEMGYRYSYQRIPLRKGYIYAYFEKQKGAGIFKEYEVSNEGEIVNLIWSDTENPRISWETPKKDRVTNYLVLRSQFDKKVWLAFSPVRWSKPYAGKVLGSAGERDKRMQSLVCESCFKGKYDNHGFAVEEAGHMLVTSPLDYFTDFSNNVKDGDYKRWENATYKAYYDRYKGQYQKNSALKKGDADNYDFYFSLFDPQGIADLLCADIAIETRNLLAMVEAMKTGDLAKAYKKVDAKDLNGNYDNPELVALIDMGILLYRMLEEKTGLFRKYKSHISPDLLKSVLRVGPRADLRRKINNIRELLADITLCEAYQLSIQDYLDKDTQVIVKGKRSLSGHLDALASPPEKIDGHLDRPLGDSGTVSATEKKIGDCINKVLSGESNTGKLIRKEWNLDEIVPKATLTRDTLDSLGDVSDSLLKYIVYIREDQRMSFLSNIFRFTTRNGDIFIKIPESVIPDELRTKVDYSRLRTTTLSGNGRGFLIKLSDATDVHGNPISGSLAKFRSQNTAISVSLDKLMPEWQKQLAKANSKGEKWAAGFRKLVETPQFVRAMTGITILSITHAIQKEDRNNADNLNLIGSVFYLANLKRDYLARLAPALMGKVGPRALGVITIGFFSVASIVDGFDLVGKNQATAGTLAIISGASGGLGGFGVILGFSNPYTMALLVISFSSAIIVEFIRDTKLQLLLKNCAYGNNYKLSAQLGIELLKKALQKNVQDGKLKSYLHDQQETLNQLIYIEQHAVRTQLTLYYSYKTRHVNYTTIHESTTLNYLEVSVNIWCMPLLDGEINVSIYNTDKQGVNSSVEPLLAETNIVQINALEGVAVVRFEVEDAANNTRKFTGGTLKVVVQIKNPQGQCLPSVNGVPRGIVSYFPYQNKLTKTVTQTKTIGGVQYDKTSEDILKDGKLFASPKADREKLEIIETKKTSTIR